VKVARFVPGREGKSNLSFLFNSKELPNAEITFDKFHVMKAMNEGVNEVRIEEQKKLKNLKMPSSYG